MYVIMGGVTTTAALTSIAGFIAVGQADLDAEPVTSKLERRCVPDWLSYMDTWILFLPVPRT